ncbi:MAG: hypothetical protein ABIF92_00750 [archaeon]
MTEIKQTIFVMCKTTGKGMDTILRINAPANYLKYILDPEKESKRKERFLEVFIDLITKFKNRNTTGYKVCPLCQKRFKGVGNFEAEIRKGGGTVALSITHKGKGETEEEYKARKERKKRAKDARASLFGEA